MSKEQENREFLCDIGRRIYNLGFVAANDGNFSMKVGEDEYLCTPTGTSKGFMTPDMICRVNGKGEVLESSGNYKPSSEIKMHLKVYHLRPDVGAVVHAHPPYATSYAIAGIPLNKPIMPEAIISLGSVPIAKYGTPSTDEVPESIECYLDNYDAVLLENHGALTWGTDLINAYYKMESLEFYAKLMYISSQIGGAQEFSREQVQSLFDLRKVFNMQGKHPSSLPMDEAFDFGDKKIANQEEIQVIVQKVTENVLKALRDESV